MDVTIWLNQVILPKARKVNKKGTVLLHPTCASRLLGVSDTFLHIAQTCAERVVVPDGVYSLARTCEISMQTTLGRPYESGVYLVDKTLEM